MKSITDVSHPDNSQYDSEYILRVHVLVWSNPRSSLPENTARGQPPIPWQTLSPRFRKKLYVIWSQVGWPFAPAVWLHLLATVRGSTVGCSACSDLRSTKRRPWNFGYARVDRY